MAGLGEACSHIAATLFAVETAVRLIKDTTCTSKPCEWIRPSSQKISYAEGSDIDFSSPQRKRKQQSCSEIVTPKQPKGVLSGPTADEALEFYSALANTGTKCAILSVIAPHVHAYVPRAIIADLPQPLPDTLYDESCITMGRQELLDKSKAVFATMSVTQETADAIEKETQSQAQSRVWFDHRAGRVTASIFRAAAHTDPNKPSKSLIQRICYPQSYKFHTAATRWGCEHESVALQAYEVYLRISHDEPAVSSTGLNLNPRYPHLGASPDGTVSCGCCENGLVEVKCPHCTRDKSLEEAVDHPRFCLEKTDAGNLQLKKTHAYFYQVQAQLHIAEVAFCDFVVFQEEGELFVRRIYPDAAFWEVAVRRVDEFYVCGVLPELIGKCFTRASVQSVDTGVDGLCCYCQRPAEGDMLHCKGDTCKIIRFHRQCISLKRVPKHDWFCITCRKLKKKNKV